MSTVILDTITGKSTATTITIGSTPVVSASANSMTIRGEGSNQTSIQQGLAKHFVNYDAQEQVTRASLNQTSLTDHGTGDFSTFYTNNMSSAENRCILTDIFNTKNEGGGENSGEHRAGGNSCQAGDTAQSTTRVNFHTYYGSSGSGDGAKEDHDGSYCATFGDLS